MEKTKRRLFFPSGRMAVWGEGAEGKVKQMLSQVLHTTEGGKERTDTEGVSWLPRDSSAKRRYSHFWPLQAAEGAHEATDEDAECILQGLRSLTGPL